MFMDDFPFAIDLAQPQRLAKPEVVLVTPDLGAAQPVRLVQKAVLSPSVILRSWIS